METYELAPGLRISRILTGLWQIADMERGGTSVDPQATAAAMTAYAEAGFTTFDMADHYGSAEDVTGVFLRDRTGSAEVQVLTKWVPKPGAVSPEEAREAVQRALERLGVEQLDLLQFHAWNYADPSYFDSLFVLQELKKEGLIAHLGVTNFDTAHLRMALESGIELVSNQVSFSLLDQRAAGAMSELCEKYGVRLLAYGTLAGGLLSERYLGQPEPDSGAPATWSQMKYRRFLDVAGGWETLQRLLRILARIGERLGVSIANLACRAILEQPAVAGIIIGARLTESEHIAENLRLFDFELDDAARQELDEVLATLRAIPGDCGDEYRKSPFLTASGDLRHHIDTFPAPYEAEHGPDGSERVHSGTVWEELAGFCRAVRRGRRIWVSGTTASHGERLIGGSDATSQTHFVIDKIEAAIVSLGGRLEDIVRTRVYVQHLDDWEAVARVHGERFADVMPANTLIQARLIGDENLVEMEAEALLPES